MKSNAQVILLTDYHGRILAAQLPDTGEAHGKREAPTIGFVALEGQRMISVSLPGEAMGLTRSDLHRYFSEVKINSEGQPELPKIKVERMHKE